MSGHSPTLRNPELWCASLTAPPGARLFLLSVMRAVARKQVFCPRQEALGKAMHRRGRTVRRWTKLLTERGWLRVIRRGRKLTNIYRLSRSLFYRLTGQRRRPCPADLQPVLSQFLARAGLRIEDAFAPAPLPGFREAVV